MKFHIRDKETLKAFREKKKIKPYTETQEWSGKQWSCAFKILRTSIFICIYMSNQLLSEEWEEKGHFQMCQVLEATVACPSPFYGGREGREARRQGSRKGERPTAIQLLVSEWDGPPEGQHQGSEKGVRSLWGLSCRRGRCEVLQRAGEECGGIQPGTLKK